MTRPIRIDGEVAYVPLTQGYEALIDAADVPLVAGKDWCALIHRFRDGTVRTAYAMRTEAGRTILMHRTLAGAQGGVEVDHIDGNGLNNSRANLRCVTRAQNMQNARRRIDSTSGVKGVCWDKWTGKWKAQIAANGKRRERRFDTIEEAAAWYAQESNRLHGEFGRAA